jgi:hypothetical protein
MSRTVYRFAFCLFFVVVLLLGIVSALLFYRCKGNAGLHDPRPPVVVGISLLEEWPLSFDAVATCPAIRSPVDDAATTRRVMIISMAMCLSFGLTGVEGRGLGSVNHNVILLRSRE